MPLDIRSQVVTALDNINRNPELYTPPKLTTPLETRINDLKETNPNKYREYISTLTSSANSGNEEARELLGKIGEDAARQRRGYEGLNTAMYAPAIIGAGALAAPSVSRNSLLPNRHPYFRYRYLSPQELKNYSTIVSSKANDTFTAIDGIERYGRYHMRNTWDLQPFKDKNNSTARILSRILPTKWSNYEIGKILGGKPFTLNTYIDYSDKFYKGYFRGPYDKSWKRNYQDFKPGL